MEELMTIRGLVIPVEWDGTGNIHAVSIFGPHEEEYVVEQDAMGKELLGLTRQWLEIRCVVKGVVQGKKTIEIKGYKKKAYRINRKDDYLSFSAIGERP